MKFKLFSLLAALFGKSAAEYRDCSSATEWDVIVVGAGAAGSIVASDLASLEDKCVLVIEGGKHSGQVVAAPYGDYPPSQNNFFETGWSHIHTSPETAWNTPGTYDVLNCWGKTCDYVWKDADPLVGKIVGGGGAINGALMQYPNEFNWDPYPAGWKLADMTPYLTEVETTMAATRKPSTDDVHYNDELGPNRVKSAMKLLGYEEGDEYAYHMPVPKTMGIPKVTTRGGKRASSTSVYLEPKLSQSNIQLWTETTANKIILSGTTATGLEVTKEGTDQTVSLASNGLLVVSGGGVKTAHLLLASDIGPGMTIDNPYVGQNLTDKMTTVSSYTVADIKSYDYNNPPQADQEAFVDEGKGPLTQFGPLLVGFIDATNDETPAGKVNLVEFFVPAAKAEGKIDVFYVHLTPKKGTAYIDSTPQTTGGPTHDWEYTSKSFQTAIDEVTKAMTTLDPNYKLIPGEIPHNAMNHPAGTCELGKCINKDTMIVEGLTNVAVCDNSILPEQAVVHSVFSLMAIARKGGDILKTFWDSASGDEL